MRLLALFLVVALGGCSSAQHKSRYIPVTETQVPMAASVLAVGHPNGKIVSGGGTVTVAKWRGIPCLLTAWHIVNKGNQSITVTGNGVTQYFGPFVKINSDLAWCRLERIPDGWRPFEVASSVHLGPVDVWGYPSREGKLSNKPGEVVKIGDTHMTINGLALPGMSGGPVLQNGKVIGVVSQTWYLKTKKEIHFAALLPRK